MGTVQAWRHVTAAVGRVRGQLARYLPFPRRTVTVEAKASRDSGCGAEAGSAEVRIERDAEALDTEKVELLHRQIDLLQQQGGR
jgi:hypothetical protein